MSRHDPIVRVRHMIDHAREAIEMAAAHTRQDLDQNRMLDLALVRLMTVIGEAASRITDDFRHQHPNVPWRDVADLRNRLIHGYDQVDFDRLWEIIQTDLPPLITELEQILSSKQG